MEEYRVQDSEHNSFGILNVGSSKKKKLLFSYYYAGIVIDSMMDNLYHHTVNSVMI